jgi:gluconate 5-dehydrogenase
MEFLLMSKLSKNENPFSLADKVMLITGAAGGLGFAMASLAASSGAHVVLNDRGQTQVDEAVARIRAADGKASGVAFDVTSSGQVDAAIKEVITNHGRIDIVVSNAGIQKRKPFIEYTLAEWNAIVDVHLTGSFLVCQAVAKQMVVQGEGSIIMIGSVAVQSVRGTIAPYTAAKGGVTALARALAVELGPKGVRCNVISPGFHETEFNRAMLDDEHFYKAMAERVPLKRWGKPSDLAPAVVFLASDAARYINGQTLVVDGGLLAAL